MSLLEPGSRIVDRYVVQTRLGSGGMATVYHCIDAMNGEPVAVKLLHGHLLADNQEVVERFKRESSVMAHLSDPTAHPNVVAVRDVIHREDLMAIVMELVEGGLTLEELLQEQGPLSESESVSLMAGVLAGLQFIHQRGILHRDLKPSNILLSRDSTGQWLPKIADFGIAGVESAASDMALAGTLTQTESMFGSPAFMAPELFDSATAASIQSDLYAMGVVLYRMLTDELPFVVDSMPSHVMRVSTQPAPSPRGVSPNISGDIERAVAVALAKDPGERFDSASVFTAALEGRNVDALGGEMATSDHDPQRIGRDYRVVRRIGRGPIANVYECMDDSLGVPFAVKVLRGKDEGRRTRFVAVAKAQAQLHQGRPHQSITAIRHIIADESTVALVEDYVDGLSIDRYIGEARPDLATLLRLFVEASDGLAHAHRLGVLHGNLKPSNVLVSWSGDDAAARRRPRAKLSDFGMSTVAGLPRAELARRTESRAFLAPELFAEGSQVTQSSDVYGLAALMLLGLLGRFPPEDSAGQTDLRTLIPDNVPEKLHRTLARGVSQLPQERPSADELRSLFDRCLRELTGEQSPLDTGPVSPMQPLPEPPSPKPSIALWLVIGTLIVGGAAAVAWFVASSNQEETADAAGKTSDETIEEPPTETPDAGAKEVVEEPDYIDVSADVARLFADNTEVVSDCLKQSFKHEKASQLSSASGALKIEVSVDSDGVVEQVEIVHDDLAMIEFGGCVASRVEEWEFPGSGREEVWEKEWIF